jgi:murein DD-endopeptidase MepM/ murein hydrolase activator NlpD
LPGNPFAKLEIRLLPENFADLGKLPEEAIALRHDEKVVALARKQSLAAQLRAAEIAAAVAKSAEAAMIEGVGADAVSAADRMKLTFARAPQSAEQAGDLVRLSLYAKDEIVGIVGRKDDGAFAPVAAPEAPKPVAADKGDRLSVYAAIYETGLRQGVPRGLLDELVRVYSYDVDFQRGASSADTIDFLYAEPESGSDELGELMFAAITVGGETKSYFRYGADERGAVDFYDPAGRSGRKFLLRMPLPSGELRSGFGYRRHPILGYMKMHTGVDWSNRPGTPILAAGNGVVRKAAWDSGYGRRVELEHANGYITTYSHMSGFGDGIEDGVKVRQGQVIGYLGSSGLSTGPHLHYEVIVNDNFLDPMAIKLPRGKELQGKELDAFKLEKARIETLIVQSESVTTAEIAQAGASQ